MDESQTYQQRLDAIAERRQHQEEEKRQRREAEEEWLKTAQKKRQCLREQWLSETAPSTQVQTKSEKTPEVEAADVRTEEEASQETNRGSEELTAAAAARTKLHYKAGPDRDTQVSDEAEDQFLAQMAQRMFHESGLDGRSVLGTVSVQVERDPQTGVTVVRSVAPVSPPAHAPMPAAIFDDGRKSIHALGGGAGEQPSSEELGQILSAIDGVGMRALLDHVEVTPSHTQADAETVDPGRAPEAYVMSSSTHRVVSEEGTVQSDGRRSHTSEAEIDGCASATSVEYRDRSEAAGIDMTGKEVFTADDGRLDEGPVTLLFLGYADAVAEQSEGRGGGEEEGGAGLTVERVIITEEGEEHVLGPHESAAPPQAGGEPREGDAFQDVSLGPGGNGAGAKGPDGAQEPHSTPLANRAEGGGSPKRKTCQCCSVM